jgi:hypothetical protein
MAGRSTLEDVQRLISVIDEEPETLASPEGLGRTPLHLAFRYRSHFPAILQLLLDRSPIRVLSMCDSDGSTPLLHPCFNVVPADIIRQVILIYPKALRVIANLGDTPLHVAGQGASLEVSELLVLHCPEASLLLASATESPYDRVVLWRPGDLDVVASLQAATPNAVLALLICVNQTLVTVLPAVLTHVRQAIPGLFEEGSSLNYMNSNEAIRQALHDQDTVKNLLQNDDLQSLLKEENCQDHIRGVYPLLQAGRIHADREDSKHHMFIMESVSDSPVFLYLHLRSHLFSLLPDR